MVFLLAFAGNVAGLFWYKQTAGPSGALYGLEGLTYGFAFLNAIMLYKKGMHFLRSFLRSFQNFLPLVLGLAIVIVIPIVAVIDPVDFFTLSIQGVKVAGGVHLFCFFTGIATSLIFGFVTSGKMNYPRRTLNPWYNRNLCSIYSIFLQNTFEGPLSIKQIRASRKVRW